jgi:hypothetical protein
MLTTSWMIESMSAPFINSFQGSVELPKQWKRVGRKWVAQVVQTRADTLVSAEVGSELTGGCGLADGY